MREIESIQTLSDGPTTEDRGPSAPTSAQRGSDWPSHHLPHWEGAVQSSHTAHRRVLEWDTPPRQAPTLFSQAYHATSYKLSQPEPSSCYSCRVSQLSHRDASLSCDQCPCSRRMVVSSGRALGGRRSLPSCRPPLTSKRNPRVPHSLRSEIHASLTHFEAKSSHAGMAGGRRHHAVGPS